MDIRTTFFAASIACIALHLGAAHALGDRPLGPPNYNYQGQWQGVAGPTAQPESGWAMNIAQQGTTLYITWFTYDTDGRAMWLVMPSVERTRYVALWEYYAGPIYRLSGPAFDADPWDSARVETVPVGTARFVFTSGGSGTFEYTVQGTGQTKTVAKQHFASSPPYCAAGNAPGPSPNYTDRWWPTVPGWGVAMAHQGNVIFATWFTFRPDRRDEWLVMPRMERAADGRYRGTIYRARGPALTSNPWNSAQVQLAAVGSASLGFVEASYVDGSLEEGYAVFEYTLDGITQSRVITRQVFSGPPTVCS